MEKSVQKTVALLRKSYAGQLTAEEQAEVDRLLADDDMQQLYAAIGDDEYLIRELRRYNSWVPARGFQAFRKKKRQQKARRVAAGLSVAASLLIALGSVWLLTEREKTVTLSDIAPGQQRAYLLLSNKKQIDLSGKKSETLLVGRGVKVRIDSLGKVSYQDISREEDKQELEYHTLVVPRAGEYYLELNDGTRVWMNAESELCYPVVFAGNERKVQLKGEAYFEVAPDDSKPFIVRTSRMEVKVLGTQFNVNAYTDNDIVAVTLVNGSIEVTSGTQEPIILQPGEQACGGEGALEKQKVNVRLYTSWIDGKFMFNNVELGEIAKQISRWYDVEIFFTNESVKKNRFTGGIMKFKPLEELLRMIESTGSVHCEVKERTIVISE